MSTLPFNATKPLRKWPIWPLAGAACSLGFLLLAIPTEGAERQTLSGHVPRAVKQLNLQPVGRLPGTETLRLAVGLPLRDRKGLDTLLQQLYDPASPLYQHYLTPAQFAERFGPTKEHYQAVLDFVKTNGLTVTCTYPNRTLLDVKGSVEQIEKVFHLTMRTYQHPAEARTFFAPDVEPSLDLAVPLRSIIGLDNYAVPHRVRHQRTPPGQGQGPMPMDHNGSGSGGSYMAADLRNAYVPGVSLTGAGQRVGLVELASYLPSDIAAYESSNNLPAVTLTNVQIDDFSSTDMDSEVAEDIEFAIAMAPGLSEVIVYQAPRTIKAFTDLFNGMATDTNSLGEARAKQLSCSWANLDVNYNGDIFAQFAAMGQSFFVGSGDQGAYPNSPPCPNTFDPIPWPNQDPYATSVGGTMLTMTKNGGAWVSETVWSNTNGASSGGIDCYFDIPTYQQGLDMSANQGSTTMRNIPDVAMIADDIWFFYNNQPGVQGGTSAAAPLWAGFMALVNQQRAQAGLPSVGFANPAIYAIGQGPNYTSCFHDITTGNNTNVLSPHAFYAVSGYDLCTGWGTPNGTNLINALAYFNCVWVNFSNPNPGDGSVGNPYNTLARGANGVLAGGTILIKSPGSSPETMTISKAMTIQSVGGTATIGH